MARSKKHIIENNSTEDIMAIEFDATPVEDIEEVVIKQESQPVSMPELTEAQINVEAEPEVEVIVQVEPEVKSVPEVKPVQKKKYKKVAVETDCGLKIIEIEI